MHIVKPRVAQRTEDLSSGPPGLWSELSPRLEERPEVGEAER